jgi:hypothetical protein
MTQPFWLSGAATTKQTVDRTVWVAAAQSLIKQKEKQQAAATHPDTQALGWRIHCKHPSTLSHTVGVLPAVTHRQVLDSSDKKRQTQDIANP